MKITAHRGYSGLYPENTMLAFEKAQEAGADEIELDVQLSRDGVVIIFHDESLDRLTGQTGFVRDLDYAGLKKLNAALSVYGNKFGVNPIPSLDEYFAWVKNTGIITNIELKNSVFYYEGLEEKTLGLIKKHGLEERVYFSSFNHISLLKCKKMNPAIPCGALTGMALGNPGYYVRNSGLDYYHPSGGSLNAQAAADCRKHGISVNVWTVDDIPGLIKARDLGCRSVITNYPSVCKAWVIQGMV